MIGKIVNVLQKSDGRIINVNIIGQMTSEQLEIWWRRNQMYLKSFIRIVAGLEHDAYIECYDSSRLDSQVISSASTISITVIAESDLVYAGTLFGAPLDTEYTLLPVFSDDIASNLTATSEANMVGRVAEQIVAGTAFNSVVDSAMVLAPADRCEEVGILAANADVQPLLPDSYKLFSREAAPFITYASAELTQVEYAITLQSSIPIAISSIHKIAPAIEVDSRQLNQLTTTVTVKIADQMNTEGAYANPFIIRVEPCNLRAAAGIYNGAVPFINELCTSIADTSFLDGGQQTFSILGAFATELSETRKIDLSEMLLANMYISFTSGSVSDVETKVTGTAFGKFYPTLKSIGVVSLTNMMPMGAYVYQRLNSADDINARVSTLMNTHSIPVLSLTGYHALQQNLAPTCEGMLAVIGATDTINTIKAANSILFDGITKFVNVGKVQSKQVAPLGIEVSPYYYIASNGEYVAAVPMSTRQDLSLANIMFDGLDHLSGFLIHCEHALFNARAMQEAQLVGIGADISYGLFGINTASESSISSGAVKLLGSQTSILKALSSTVSTMPLQMYMTDNAVQFMRLANLCAANNNVCGSYVDTLHLYNKLNIGAAYEIGYAAFDIYGIDSAVFSGVYTFVNLDTCESMTLLHKSNQSLSVDIEPAFKSLVSASGDSTLGGVAQLVYSWLLEFVDLDTAHVTTIDMLPINDFDVYPIQSTDPNFTYEYYPV